MQRIFYGLLAILFIASCGTPQTATTSTQNQPAMGDPVTVMQADFRKNAPEPGPAPKIELGDFQDFKLDNGLQVILVENHKLPRVSYQLFVDVPNRVEGANAGAGSLMGSMLRRATSDMDKDQIDEAIDFIGASLSTSSSGAYASTITKYREDVLDLMSKVILDAKFTQEDFEKVKDDALAGLKSSLANPDAIAGRVRRAVVYGKDHPYGELVTEQNYENMDLAAVKDVYDTYFVPNRSYLVMVGDLTRPDAEQLAKEYFGDWKAKSVVEPEFELPTGPDGTQVVFVPRAGSVQSVVTVAHPVELEPGSKEAIRASVVNSILGSGFNGRLFQNLREDKAYTYGAYSSISDDKLIGNFRASTSVRNEVTDSAVYEIIYEMNKIASEKVTDDELRRAKAQVAGSFGRALESPQRIAGYALNTVREGLDRDFYPTYLQKVQNSSANDLLEVSREYMAPENTYIIVVGDKSVADKLKRFDVDGKIEYYDENGDMIDMEAMAAPTDVTPKQILMDYHNAIGGAATTSKVKSIKATMTAPFQGMTMQQEMMRADGDKMAMNLSIPAMGMSLNEVRYNNGKATVKAQGQAQPLEEKDIMDMKAQAALFPVLEMMNDLEALKISGTEMVDGKKTIVVEETQDGTSSQYYFDADTKLLVRRISSEGGVQSTQDYADYKAVGGVMFPHKVTLKTPQLPAPLVMTATKYEVNGTIDPAMFEVE